MAFSRPLLIIGGALGAALGQFFHTGDVGLWAAVGMAAMMGGTMRAPLTGIFFLLELTHDLNALAGVAERIGGGVGSDRVAFAPLDSHGKTRAARATYSPRIQRRSV